jgi:large subunit ribosomal protein L10
VKKERKFEIVAKLKEDLAVALAVVAVDFKGTSVAKVQEIRKELRKEGAKFQVVKNTLLIKAVQGTELEPIGKLTGGQIAIAWSDTDPAFPAKVLVKLSKTIGSLSVKGGVLSGKVLDSAGVVTLSQLPSKDEMRARLLSVFVAVPRKMLGVMLAAQRDMVGVLKAREDKLKAA